MTSTLLRVERLHKSFAGVRALDGFDGEVHEGEILGLVGPNGSGKTTLFSCVTGFVRPTGGRIEWDGRDVSGLAPDQIARLGIVRTFQHKMVFPSATVRENMLMAWQGRGASRDVSFRRTFSRCEDLLQFLGLDRLGEHLAGGIPFGSARKLGVGLALAANPRLLLLDEPAAGLHQDETHELATLVRNIRDLGVTVWVIEHDMSFIMSVCERLMVLHVGRKIAEGKPVECAEDPGVVSVFLGERFAQSRAG